MAFLVIHHCTNLQPVSLFAGDGTKDAVAGVAEAGDEVGVVVEGWVTLGGVDGDVGVLGVEAADAFFGCDEADELEAADAVAFQCGDGVAGAAAGGEHGVNDDDGGIFYACGIL